MIKKHEAPIYGRGREPCIRSLERLQVARDENAPLAKLPFDSKVCVVGGKLVRGVNDENNGDILDEDGKRFNHDKSPRQGS